MQFAKCATSPVRLSRGVNSFSKFARSCYNPRVPELPEVEVLVRHLNEVTRGKTIGVVTVHRPKIIRPTSLAAFTKTLQGSKIRAVARRGKYLLFDLKASKRPIVQLVGHLGMAGRMYMQPRNRALPKHTAVSFSCGRETFVFEDTRYFGRLTLDASAIKALGPEPLTDAFDGCVLFAGLRNCRQAIKPKLLNQSLVAGVGNIYASEALWRAGISPRRMARRLTQAQCGRLAKTIREVLAEAIAFGSAVPLGFDGGGEQDGLFYYGAAEGSTGFEERLRVYDREGGPCVNCGGAIRKIVQAGRSTYF